MSPFYLDDAATTAPDPAVLDAMAPWFAEPANPHGTTRHGTRAAAALARARAGVAAAIGADPAGLVFTSGATEAANWALAGTLTHPDARRRGIVTIATEHRAVLEPARALARLGADLTILPVGADGRVDLTAAAAAIGPDTAIVSAMLVNNETGAVQPVAELARLAHAVGAVMHCDAAQALGKLPVDVAALGADLVGLSAHKLHGPPGIGALWIRPGVALAPWLHGGDQQPGRAGTVPVALAVGFAAAAAIAHGSLAATRAHAAALREAALAALEPLDAVANGAPGWPGILNVTLPGVDAARLRSEVAGVVSFSLASACADASGRDSHVLAAMGLSRAAARATLRLSWGRRTCADGHARALATITAAALAQTRARAA